MAMWDPVVKVNARSTSQHLSIDPPLQEEAPWPNSEGEQGGTGSTWLSPLQGGEAGSEQPICWETGTKHPLSHGAQQRRVLPSVHGPKRTPGKERTKCSEARPCRLKTSSGTVSAKGTSEKMDFIMN